VTNRLPTTTEPVPQQSPPPAAAVDAYKSPTSTDPTHARGGHGIFGEPMVTNMSVIWLVMNANALEVFLEMNLQVFLNLLNTVSSEHYNEGLFCPSIQFVCVDM